MMSSAEALKLDQRAVHVVVADRRSGLFGVNFCHMTPSFPMEEALLKDVCMTHCSF